MDSTVKIFLSRSEYPNDAFEHYDDEMYEKYGVADDYTKNWPTILENTYKATFVYENDDTYIIIPEHYYTLFLLRYSTPL